MKNLFFVLVTIISLLVPVVGNSKELKHNIETCLGNVNLNGITCSKGTFRDPVFMHQDIRPLESLSSSAPEGYYYCSCRFLFMANGAKNLQFACFSEKRINSSANNNSFCVLTPNIILVSRLGFCK